MCGLTLIGLGLYGSSGLSQIGLRVAENSAKLYAETYTSLLPNHELERLKKLFSKDVQVASREFLEDGRTILDEAERFEVALFVPGDPCVATTHVDLMVRARRKGIKTSVIHNSSIISTLPGVTGLHIYKFGRTVTVTQGPGSRLTTAYNATHENLLRGLHTTLLMEFTGDKEHDLRPEEALSRLLDCEKDHSHGVFTDGTFAVVASRLGDPTQLLTGGSIKRLLGVDYGPPPHTLVIPGSLHFSELEALDSLLDRTLSSVVENSSNVHRISVSMVKKYAERTRSALEKARVKLADAKFSSLFENVECYVSDSERFLNEGKEELAVLSIGYAEGLLDSLRFTGILEVEW